MNDLINGRAEGNEIGIVPRLTHSRYAKSAIEEFRPLIKKIAARVLALPSVDERLRFESSMFDATDLQRIQSVIMEETGLRLIFDTFMAFASPTEARVIGFCKVDSPDGYIIIKTETAHCTSDEIESKANTYGIKEDCILWAEARALRYVMRSMGVIPKRPDHTKPPLKINGVHEGQDTSSADAHLPSGIQKNLPITKTSDRTDAIDSFDGDIDVISQEVKKAPPLIVAKKFIPTKDESDSPTALQPKTKDSIDSFDGDVDEISPVVKKTANAVADKQSKPSDSIDSFDGDVDDISPSVKKTANVVSSKKISPSGISDEKVETKRARVGKKELLPTKSSVHKPQKVVEVNGEVPAESKNQVAPKKPLLALTRLAGRVKEKSSTVDKSKESVTKTKPEKLPISSSVSAKSKANNALKTTPSETKESKVTSKVISVGLLSSLTKRSTGSKTEESQVMLPKKGRRRSSDKSVLPAKKSEGKTLSLKKPDIQTEEKREPPRKVVSPSVPDEKPVIAVTPSKETAIRAKIKGVTVKDSGLPRDEMIDKLGYLEGELGITLQIMLEETYPHGPFTIEEATDQEVNRIYTKFLKG